MAQKLLDGAQIAAAGKKVGGETMPKRVWRRRFGKAERRPQAPHLPLGDARVQSFAAGADEQRAVAAQGMGAGGEIVVDGDDDDGQDRHQPLLAALAGDDHGFAFRRLAPVQGQGLADAQAAAVKHGEERRVAFADPRLAAQIGDGAERLQGLLFRQRLG